MAGHTDARKTFVGRPMVAGGIWRIPQHILLPTTAYAPRPESAIRLGGVSDEGYTYQSERSVDKKKDWNGDKVRSIQTDKDDTLELTFIEFLNPNVMALAYGESNVTVEAPTTQHGTHIAVRDVSDVLDHGAFLIDTFDGKVRRRRCVPDAQPSTIDPITEAPGDWSVYKITFDLFPDSQGATNYSYTELADKLASYEYLLDLHEADSGTFSLKFGNRNTVGLDPDLTSSELLDALAGLDDGHLANDWNVTGSLGEFVITTPQGGLLEIHNDSLAGGSGPVTLTNVV